MLASSKILNMFISLGISKLRRIGGRTSAIFKEMKPKKWRVSGRPTIIQAEE
jgi:hypothetical protein